MKDNNSIKIKRIYNPRKPLSPLERKKYEEGEYIILGQLLWFYINWENPVNWKYEGKMKHIALWNPHDTVDEIAQAYDFIAFSLLPNRNYHAMTMNSDYFENDKTVNVKLDISIPLLKVFLSRRIDMTILRGNEVNSYHTNNKIRIDVLLKIAEQEEKLIDELIEEATGVKKNYEKKKSENHGFDTAMPKEILKAIKDGRIKPFERTIRERTKKQDQ